MGTGNSKDEPPTGQDRPPETEGSTTNQEETSLDVTPVNLYDKKVARLGDEELMSECLIHLKAIYEHIHTKDSVIRTISLLTEATNRASLRWYKEDFLAALRVLKFL